MKWAFTQNFLHGLKILRNRADVLKNVIFDLTGNIAITGVSQLILFPILSNNMDMAEFGSMLTLIAIANVVGSVLGGTINNVRLLRNPIYREHDYDGDFRLIVERSIIVGIVCMLAGMLFFRSQINASEWILLPLLTVLILLRSYMSIEYRMKLNYQRIMLHSLSTCCGYLLGIPIFLLTHLWVVAFLSGELCALLFAILTTKILQEPRVKTTLYKKTLGDIIQLLMSNLMVNLLMYLDRLIINPVMGAANVSIYFIASMVGKMMGVVMQPVAGVALSYMANAKKKQASIIYWGMASGTFICGIIAFTVSIPLSPIIIKLLYPKSLTQAAPFFMLANISAILGIVGSLFQPVVLRYCPLWWQIVIQLVFGSVYIGFGYFLMISHGLTGFCIGAILAQSVRFVMLLAAGFYYIIFLENVLTAGAIIEGGGISGKKRS